MFRRQLHVLLLILFGIWLPPAFAEQQTPLRVGVIVPLSGPLAPIGNAIRNGLILADEESAADRALKLRFEDDGFVPKNALSAAQKLLDLDHVEALVVFGSSTSLAVASLAEKQHVPMIAVASSREVTEGKKYVIRHLVTPEAETKELLAELRLRKYASVAVVTTYHDAMLAERQLFASAASASIVLNEDVSPQETDFRALAGRIVRLNPSAVYILLLPPQTALFAKQLRALQYKGDFFASHQVETADEVKAAEGALDGTWFVSAEVITDPAFVRRYTERFKIAPYTCTSNGYDIGKLLIEGGKQRDLSAYLHKVKNFHGIIGTYSATADNGFDLPSKLKVIKGAEFLPLH